MRRAKLWAAAVVAAVAGRAAGQEPGGADAVGGWWRPPQPIQCQPPGYYPGCPPGRLPYTLPPGTAPWTPGMPLPPAAPQTPGTLPPTTPTPPGMGTSPTQPQPTPPGQPPQQPNQPNQNQPNQPENPFARPTAGGGETARTFNEAFDGDFGAIFYTQRVVTGFAPAPQVIGFSQQVVGNNQVVTIDPAGNRIVTNVPVIQNVPIVAQGAVPITKDVRVPLGSRYQGVFITDYDGPRPVDRVYGGYNFYSNIGQGLNNGIGKTDLQRQMVGFEKTVFDGDGSFGMRLPFIQQYGPGIGSQTVGDLSLLFKYAFINNRQTGNVWSAGMVLTTPTGGGGAQLINGTDAPHSWLFQPWTGGVAVFDRFYVQALSNLVVPTDSRDITIWGNSLSFGYWAYRADAGPGQQQPLLRGIIPVAEVHVRTPLTHRDVNDLVFMQDQVNITTGVHFRTSRGVLSPAVSVPVVGPKPWAIEAMCYGAIVF